MGRRFAMRDAVALIAVGAATAAMGHAALFLGARQAARKSNCRANLHHIGIALASFVDDNDGSYHKGESWFYNDSAKYIPGCQTLGWMIDTAYIDDMALLVCPGFDWDEPREPHLEPSTTHTGSGLRPGGGCKYPADARRSGPNAPDFIHLMVGGVHDTCYVLDEGRIHGRSVPGRVVAANTISMCTYKGLEPACWDDGSNALFLDVAVKWIPKVDAAKRYTKDVVGWAEGAADGVSQRNWYGYAAVPGDVWVRYGYIPNPRLDEDECFEDDQEAGEANYSRTIIIDKDDIYEIEGASPLAPIFEQSAMFGDEDPSTDQWRRTPEANIKDRYDDDGWFSVAPSCRDGGDFADGPYCNSKIDAAVAGGHIFHQDAGQPLGWRNGRGWYAETDPNGNSNRRYAGWTWGVPAALEGLLETAQPAPSQLEEPRSMPPAPEERSFLWAWAIAAALLLVGAAVALWQLTSRRTRGRGA